MLNLLEFKKISRPVGPDHGEASLGTKLQLNPISVWPHQHFFTQSTNITSPAQPNTTPCGKSNIYSGNNFTTRVGTPRTVWKI